MVGGVRIAIGVIAVITSTAVAHADPAVEREDVVLRYTAPAACPDAAALEALVAQRAPAARFVDAAPRVFAITVTATDTGFAGDLAVSGADGAADRTLTAGRCDDLVGALALVVALAIDPDAGAPPPPPPPPEPVHVAPPVVDVGAAVAPQRPRAWEVDAAATGVVAALVTPGAMLGAGVEARIERAGLGHLDLAAIAGWDRTAMAQGTSRFTFVAGRLSACRRIVATRIDVDGCAHIEAGAISAHGDDIVNAQGSARLWLAPGVHAVVRYPLGARVFAEMQLGASIPLVRHHFYFNPDITIHRTGPVIPWVGVGIGVRFP